MCKKHCMVKIKKKSIINKMFENSQNKISISKISPKRKSLMKAIREVLEVTPAKSQNQENESKECHTRNDNDIATTCHVKNNTKDVVNKNNKNNNENNNDDNDDENLSELKQQVSNPKSTDKSKRTKKRHRSKKKLKNPKKKKKNMSDSEMSSDCDGVEDVTNNQDGQQSSSSGSSSGSGSSSTSSSCSEAEDELNLSSASTVKHQQTTDSGGCTSMGGLKYKIFLNSKSNQMNGNQNDNEANDDDDDDDNDDKRQQEINDEEGLGDDSSNDSIILKKRRKKVDEQQDNQDNGNDEAVENDEDDEEDDDDDDDDDDGDGKKKGKKGKRRKRIRAMSGSDSGSEKDSSNKKRKNIRKLIKTRDLDSETKLAARQEEERRKRIEERQRIYNVYYEKPESIQLKELVLDFDEKTKKPLLKVDDGLLKKLKPHQATGVKFMWDACFETLKDAKKKNGSGCILAHCMGLGKTLQIVTLVHTLLTNSDKTNVERVIVIAPLSTLNNWAREFVQWLKFCKNKSIEIYDMSRWKDKKTRIFKLNEWYEEGGVCILGYDMFRILSSPTGKNKKLREKLQKCLVDPGPDLVVCDEGHLLKNEKTSLSKAVTKMRTMRRIILTGTPLQNNLKEYYCMIQFIKPNLLGTYKEYMNRFVNPITNGQYTDSTEHDIRLMKHRSHVLHKLLEGCIQRRDYSVLAPYLPPKHEYVIFIQLTVLQQKLYELYMTQQKDLIGDQSGKGAKLFQDFCNLRRIWTHPLALKMDADLAYKKKLEKALFTDEDEEGSLKDFIDDDDQSISGSTSDSESFNSDKSDSSMNQNKSGRGVRRTRQNADQFDDDVELVEKTDERPPEWWSADCSEDALKSIYESPKLLLLLHILQECEKIGDKVLLFSQSLQSLDVIEHFLALIDRKTQGETVDANLGPYEGSWTPGLDYFRLDGSRTVDNRDAMCKSFNDPSNLRARLFLISTRAGGLGINLVAANRVIIFDVSWNPSHDTQSIFRVYRFGQEKPCYIYRFIALGTMEEKIYERQVTKQATAKRVLDEQQISRHYNQNDLLELYNYELKPTKPREIPILPKDRLFADILSEHEKIIYRYHEHDSLLENEESENLSEEERKAAWEEFEAEKNRPAYQPYIRANYSNGPVTSNRIFGFRTDILLRLLNLKISRDHPEMQEAQVYQMVPLYMQRLYAEINNGDRTMYNELLDLSATLQVPPSGYFSYPMMGQQQNTDMNIQQSNMNARQQNAGVNIVSSANTAASETAATTTSSSSQNPNPYWLMTHEAQTRLIQQQQQKALIRQQQQQQQLQHRQQLQRQRNQNMKVNPLPSTSTTEVYEID